MGGYCFSGIIQQPINLFHEQSRGGYTTAEDEIEKYCSYRYDLGITHFSDRPAKSCLKCSEPLTVYKKKPQFAK